jgi:hypothetical protein
MADDEIERLLREVEAELGRSPVDGRPGGAKPLPGSAAPSGASASRSSQDGVVDRVRAGVPRGVVVGAVWGLGVGTVFTILPVVDNLSGAIAAFVTGFGVSVAGRLRRR